MRFGRLCNFDFINAQMEHSKLEDIVADAGAVDDHDDRYIVRSVNGDHFLVTAGELDFSVNQDTNLHVWQSSFLEQHSFTVTESGGTVTGNLEKEGGGDLTMYFSDEFTVLDCTPACTVDLTALVGTDRLPADAFIYIPQSTKTLTAAASWPGASVEHIRVAKAILQTAATTGTDSALGNRNWNDFAFGITDPRGHGLHIAERLRAEHAKWNSGVVLSITGDGTGTVTLDVSAGTVYQLHLQAFPALDMAGADDIHLVNLVGSEYSKTSNLVADITTLADGVTALANNKYFNIVIWGVQNRTGETSHLMCNLPTGQYNTALGGTTDSSKFSVHTIPTTFIGTGFLIAELTFRLTGGGTTWTLEQNKDLLGQIPTLVPGGGTTTAVSIFSDAQFEVFDNADATKRLALQLSGITTGNVRTLTVPDTSSTILTSDGATALAGAWNMGSQNITNFVGTSGSINDMPIGEDSESSGVFSTLGAEGLVNFEDDLEVGDIANGNFLMPTPVAITGNYTNIATSGVTRLIVQGTVPLFQMLGTNGSVNMKMLSMFIIADEFRCIIQNDDTTEKHRPLVVDMDTGDITVAKDLEIDGDLNHDGSNVGFYGTAPIAQAVLATGAGATVDNVITALQNLGLVKQA